MTEFPQKLWIHLWELPTFRTASHYFTIELFSKDFVALFDKVNFPLNCMVARNLSFGRAHPVSVNAMSSSLRFSTFRTTSHYFIIELRQLRLMPLTRSLAFLDESSSFRGFSCFVSIRSHVILHLHHPNKRDCPHVNSSVGPRTLNDFQSTFSMPYYQYAIPMYATQSIKVWIRELLGPGFFWQVAPPPCPRSGRLRYSQISKIFQKFKYFHN